MPPRVPPEAPSPPHPSATAAAAGIHHLHARTRPPASSVSPHVHSSGPPFPARISHTLPTNLVMTGTLTATDSRVNSLPEIPFSRFAQQSRIEYLWSIVETRRSLRQKNRNQDDKVYKHPRDRGRGSK